MVGPGDTALALGSGDVEVLATPRLLALAERASVLAVSDAVPEGKTSVGAWVELDHLVPSRVGEKVDATSVLLGVHGRRLEFTITVTNEADEEVARLRHRRVMVSRERFNREATLPAVALPTPE